MGRVGIPCTVLDSDSEQVELLRKIGFKVHYGDATRLELLHAAGAGQAKLAVLTLASVEKSLEIVRLLQRHFPQVRILVRVRGRLEAYELLDAGVEDVYRETLDASLEMAVAGMRHLGVPGHSAVRAARQFRRHDEGAVRRMAAVRHDRAAYLSEARQSVKVLEEVLRSDAEREGLDDGWSEGSEK
jgi:voltage-gated potassium channel Kch